MAARQSSAVFGEHICVEVDSLFIVHLPSVVFMFENTAHPRGLQCTALNYILASSDCSECKQFSEYKQRIEHEHSEQMNAAKCIAEFFWRHQQLILALCRVSWQLSGNLGLGRGSDSISQLFLLLYFSAVFSIVFLSCISQLHFSKLTVCWRLSGDRGLGGGTDSINMGAQYLHILTAPHHPNPHQHQHQYRHQH